MFFTINECTPRNIIVNNIKDILTLSVLSAQHGQQRGHLHPEAVYRLASTVSEAEDKDDGNDVSPDDNTNYKRSDKRSTTMFKILTA
jgi:hypothetical protein